MTRIGPRVALALLLAGCAGTVVRFPSAPPNGSVALLGTLVRPDGAGPLPALVLLHHCGGLSKNIFDWAGWLSAEGYAALVVDSFSPRGTTNVCTSGRNPSVDEVALDAFGALAYLRSLPFINPDRIGVMGWSFGAGAALRASADRVVSQTYPQGGGFRAAVAFYGHCSAFTGDTSIPVLLLMGEKDDWTSPRRCVSTAEWLQRTGRPIVWKVYPGARNAFDDGQYGIAPRQYAGHTMQYDPRATADAEKQVRDFLARHLRGK